MVGASHAGRGVTSFSTLLVNNGLADLRLPHDCQLYLAADTGTFLSALIVAIDTDNHAFALAEFPNYRYVSDQCELNDISTPEWATTVVATMTRLGGIATAWADPNSQFKEEMRRYGLRLVGNKTRLETRVSIAREYFANERVHLAPWLQVLPYELENAKWPDEASSTGKYARINRSDHTLDCLEHILSRRPRITQRPMAQKKGFLEQYLEDNVTPSTTTADIHLGNG